VGRRPMMAEILLRLGIFSVRTGSAVQALDLLVAVVRSAASDDFTARDAHPVALQEIRIRIEERIGALRFQDALSALREALEAQVGAEIVASALTSRESSLRKETAAEILAGVMERAEFTEKSLNLR
jgi:hypothetical protein